MHPIADFLEIVGNIKKLIVKRGHKLIDYDRHRLALEKSKERKDRQANDERKVAELEQKFEIATRDYTSINNVLMSELPEFLNYRVYFIDPCFQTLYAVQLKVYRTMADTFYSLAQNTCDLTTSPYEGWEKTKGEGQRLISELTILKGSWKTAGHIGSPQDSTDDFGYASPTNDPRGSQDMGERGNAPPPYESAKLFPSANPSGSSSSAGAGRKAAPPPPSKPKPRAQMVVALYDFAAQQPGDLSFNKVCDDTVSDACL